MSTEIIELMRAALKEELAPIHQRLDTIETRLDTIETRLDSVEQDVKTIKLEQQEFKKDIITRFGYFTETVANHFEDKTNALNKRIYEIETTIQRLTRQ